MKHVRWKEGDVDEEDLSRYWMTLRKRECTGM
jgi:hypothetical protein